MANKSNKHYLSTMEEHSIQITKTGRYFSLGSLSKKTTSVWIVCHGYGQLANYFLRNFNVLEDENTYIVAPEGFHRYYLNGFSGRVGASWMTKEDRLSDIDDYVNYLDRVYKSIFSKIDRKNATVNVLGFSQGGATTTRWACQGKSIIDNLILWAAVYPPDLNFEVDAETLNKLNFKLIIGDKDEFISENTLEKHIKILNEKEINHELIRYKGIHKIETKTLIDLSNSLNT